MFRCAKTRTRTASGCRVSARTCLRGHERAYTCYGVVTWRSAHTGPIDDSVLTLLSGVTEEQAAALRVGRAQKQCVAW